MKLLLDTYLHKLLQLAHRKNEMRCDKFAWIDQLSGICASVQFTSAFSRIGGQLMKIVGRQAFSESIFGSSGVNRVGTEYSWTERKLLAETMEMEPFIGQSFVQ